MKKAEQVFEWAISLLCFGVAGVFLKDIGTAVNLTTCIFDFLTFSILLLLAFSYI